METRVESPKAFNETGPRLSGETPHETIGRLVTALRLFKKGNVAFDVVICKPAIKNPLFLGSLSATGPFQRWGGTYRFGKEEITAFESLWGDFKGRDLSSPSAVKMALRRFNFGYSREQLEDKLLDFMISFEALLLKENEGSNTHKLALRTAKLLGDTFDEKQKVYREMKSFYGKRSAMVHGESTKLDDTTVSNTEELLRQSIRKILDGMKTSEHSDILSHLDLD